ANPELTQLYQRIPMLTTLVPLDLEDTSNYIEHRLRTAGYQGPPLFTSAALRIIWQSSGGIPREINSLCFNALLLARAVEQKQIDSDILSEVVGDLDLGRIERNLDSPAHVLSGQHTRPQDPITYQGGKCSDISESIPDANLDPGAINNVDVGQVRNDVAGLAT